MAVFIGTNGNDVADAPNGTLTGFTDGTLAELTDADGDVFFGGDGADRIAGGAGGDIIYGEDGNDTLISDSAGDILIGGSGDDRFILNFLISTATTIVEDPGGGMDTIQLNLTDDPGTYTSTVFAMPDNVENVFVFQTVDSEFVVFGNDMDNFMEVEPQTIGTVELRGGVGNDTLSLVSSAVDVTGFGGEGDDTYVLATDEKFAGGSEKVVEDPDAGNDTIVWLDQFEVDTLNLSSYPNIENMTVESTNGQGIRINGTDVDNILRVTEEDNTGTINRLFGYDGNDWLVGRGKNEEFSGGEGDDTLTGGTGNNTIDGGAGFDTVDYRDNTTGVVVSLSGSTPASVDNGNGTDSVVNVEAILGGSGNDMLAGDGLANSLVGNDGNDTIAGGGGNDTMAGGGGFDILNYSGSGDAVTVRLGVTGPQAVSALQGTDVQSGFEGVWGSAHADALFGDGAANLLSGGAGDDTIYGGAGDDTLVGAAGFDTLNHFFATGGVTVNLAAQGVAQAVGGGEGTDTFTGFEAVFGSNAGADVIDGDDGANALTGWGGNDTLRGNAGEDTLIGGGGDDVLAGGAGDDVLDGGAGFDTLNHFFATGGVTVNLAAQGVAQAVGGGEGTDTFTGFEAVFGSSTGADAIDGDGAANRLTGWGGDDTLRGNAGNDTLVGLAGNDVLAGGAGNDLLDGGAGVDTATFADASEGVVVNLALAGAQAVSAGQGSDIFVSIENVTGSAFNDTIMGDDGANILIGGGGNDRLHGGAGNDTMDGGAGFDALNYFFASGGVSVDLRQEGVAQAIGGGQGFDTFFNIHNLIGSGSSGDVLDGDAKFNQLFGYAGNDTLRGHGGNDTVWGGGNDDLIGGGDGDDLLHGEAGGDRIYGGAGSDTIIGGAGGDQLFGGADADVFRFLAVAESGVASRDTIDDFVSGLDRLDLSAIDADTTTAGNGAFTFIGGAAFSGAGQVRFVTNGTDGWLQANVNGNLAADMVINLLGVTSLSAGDMIL